jgi:hypothetical protein
LAWASCLFDREYARQNVVIRHEELVQTNGVYAYFGKKLDPVAGSRAVGINNTMMMMAHQVLVEAYERHDTIVWTKDARAAQALWRATSRTPPWAMAAAKTALFYFSHLPEADRATAMGQLVYGTALSYLGEPKRAMGAYTDARRADDSRRADRLFVQQFLPMYFDIMPFRPTHPGHCSVHYDGLELKLELVKHATRMSGSADMLRFCEAWRLAEQRHGRWHVKAAFTGDDCDKFMFEGKHAALRAYVSLRSKTLQAGVWVRRTLRVLRTWQAERADPAEWAILGQEGRRWQRQMSAVQSLLEPLETDEDESDDEP